MSCPTHGTACAYQEPGLLDICPVCHAPWQKIEAPYRIQKGKLRIHTDTKGKIRDDTDYRYPGGYGQSRDEHLAGHSADQSRTEARRHRRAVSVPRTGTGATVGA
jgi:hypothetical protein